MPGPKKPAERPIEDLIAGLGSMLLVLVVIMASHYADATAAFAMVLISRFERSRCRRTCRNQAVPYRR